jgi:uncharacterized protein with ParB-like and HNH nuclease domain
MPDPKSQIVFEQTGLGDVLKKHLLVVPSNQREYAWTDEEVVQLFQDFGKALGDGSEYFLGTLVTIPRRNGTLEVVDGQQRLATTALLLAAIRDYLFDKNEEVLVESINNEFLTGIDRSKRARVPKLKLNVDDNELFNQLVTGVATDKQAAQRASQRRLIAAHSEAQKFVKQVVATTEANLHGDI